MEEIEPSAVQEIQTIPDAAEALIGQFTLMDEILGGAHERRSAAARELYRAARDPGNNAVRVWFKRDGEFGKLRFHLTSDKPVSAERRHAWIQEDGACGCDCPDHEQRGTICKHIRAAAGVAFKEAFRR